MAVDATTIARFFRRDQSGHENDRHFVQRPVRFELRRYFKAVGLWHDKIDEHEIGLEATGGFQRPPRIVHCAGKEFPVCSRNSCSLRSNLGLLSTISTRGLQLVALNRVCIS